MLMAHVGVSASVQCGVANLKKSVNVFLSEDVLLYLSTEPSFILQRLPVFNLFKTIEQYRTNGQNMYCVTLKY